MTEAELLLAMLESVAEPVSIFHFSTGWKIGLGTPDLVGGRGYGQVWHQETHATILDALRAFIADPTRIDEASLDNACSGFPCREHPRRERCL